MASLNRRLMRDLGTFVKVRHARTTMSTTFRHFSLVTKLCHQNVLYGAVCVQRLPVITAPRSDIENRYSDLMSKIELEKSYYSDFELRLKKESQTAKKEKESAEESGESLDTRVETGLDLQDKWDTEVKEFVTAPRETEADRTNDQRSLERKLDSSLYLLVRQKIEGNDHWVLPQALWEEGETLRQTAERALSTLCGDVRATFLGNAPCAVAKFEPVVKEGDKKVKLFFFKAWYREGDVTPNKQKASDYLWVTREELAKCCHRSYQKHLRKFVFDL